MTAWRLLHGKLFVGAFLRRIHRPDAAGHRCPHPGCVDQAATFTHVMMACPLAAAVWDWFAAVIGEDEPLRSTDLLLADNQRTWRPASQLRPPWHRLRLATISQLWAAYQRARHQPDTAQSAGAVAARILASCRKALLGDWRPAAVTIRQTAGVLSDWLRGPQADAGGVTLVPPGQCWVLGAEPDAQLLIHWSAQHSTPLPA